MNRTEAIRYFETKHERARGYDSIDAYANILHILNDDTRTWEWMKGQILTMARTSPRPARRAIYRKALREMEI